jgi:hypothetical protein
MNYVLDEAGDPVPEPDPMKWAEWFGTAERHVDQVVIRGESTGGEPVRISTVFLGLDHNFAPGGAPILYETMVFGGDHDGFTKRYATRAEAWIGHRGCERMVRGAGEP